MVTTRIYFKSNNRIVSLTKEKETYIYRVDKFIISLDDNTLEIINKIWTYRNETNSKVCFTLDAGANVHVLYPEHEKDTVLVFIKNELVAYCQNGQYICDQVGNGAKKM